MDSAPENEIIRKYLNRITVQLMFGVPRAERVAIREEITQHLNTMVEDEVTQGKSREEAIRAALRRFGDPVKIGREIRKRWLRKHPHLLFGDNHREIVWKAIYWLLSFSIFMATMLLLSDRFSVFISGHGFFQIFVGSLGLAFVGLAILGVSGMIATVVAQKATDPVMELLLQRRLLSPPKAKKSNAKRRQKDTVRVRDNSSVAIAMKPFLFSHFLSSILSSPVWKKVGSWASNALTLWMWLYLAWHLFNAFLKGLGAVWEFAAILLGCSCGMIAFKYLWALLVLSFRK